MSKLSGTWYNELGSKMILAVDGAGGLSGSYYSAVGDAQDFYILAGRYDNAPPSGAGTSLGWAVTFYNNKNNAHSTSTWSGQYFNDASGERILTNWLLTSSTPAASVWNSTNIGNDTFTRNPPKAQPKIAKARALTADSSREEILSHFFHFVRVPRHTHFFSDTDAGFT
jgi:hypothetical protein